MMEEFYAYLTEITPETAHFSRKDRLNCRKTVLRAMQTARPRVRRSLRIALVLSAAALGVSMIVPAVSAAKRTPWRDTFAFSPVRPAAEIAEDMETLAPVLVTEQQSSRFGGYQLTLTGYACDWMTGSVFFELTVPEGFDWKYPYLTAAGGVTRADVGQTADKASLTYLTGLARTDRPNVLAAECSLHLPGYGTDFLAAQPACEITFPQIELRDQYTDFDDKTGAYLAGSANPHSIVFDAHFTLKTDPSVMYRETADPQLGTCRVTPFGVYYYSVGDRGIAQHYEALDGHVAVTCADGTVLTPENSPASLIRSAADPDETPSGMAYLIYPRPLAEAQIAQIGAAPGDAE